MTEILDELLEKRLRQAGCRRSTRRGLLTWVGRTLVAAAGLALVPVLPLNRRSVVRAQGITCGDNLCGQCGHQCSPSCSCGSGGTGGCPSCLKIGSFSWTACCFSAEFCENRYMGYWDCCSDVAGSETCSGTWCNDNCNQSQWCLNPNGGGSLGAYRCTIPVDYGPC